MSLSRDDAPGVDPHLLGPDNGAVDVHRRKPHPGMSCGVRGWRPRAELDAVHEAIGATRLNVRPATIGLFLQRHDGGWQVDEVQRVVLDIRGRDAWMRGNGPTQEWDGRQQASGTGEQGASCQHGQILT